MGKITRYSGNVQPFAINAALNDRTTFGTTTTGDDTLDGNVTVGFLTGWGIVSPSESPTLEDFNAVGFTLGQYIAYLHQMGVAEWNGTQEYQVGSIVNRAGLKYVCQTTDHSGATPPESDAVNWKLDPASGIGFDNAASGLTATTVQAAIDESYAATLALSGKTIASGSATFTNSNNNISLPGIGVGVEVGDVISIAGSTNNDTEFTIEFITDANNVIANAAHAGKSRTVEPIGTKALIDETATVTVTLLCKWFHAPIGLGQGWTNVLSGRSLGSASANNTKRTIKVSVLVGGTQGGSSKTMNVLLVDDAWADGGTDSADGSEDGWGSEVPPGSSYKVLGDGSSTLSFWSELR